MARGAAIALAGFALVALPWIAVLSAGLGRLSVGESAGLNYGWIVNRPEGQRIETGLTAFGAHEGLAHPPVQLLAAPAVYEFDGGVPGTAAALARSGLLARGRRHALQPVAASARGARQPCSASVGWPSAGRRACSASPCWPSRSAGTCAPGDGRCSSLALAGAPLAMYVAIHIEYRYIGAFVVLLLTAAFAAMRGPDTPAGAAADRRRRDRGLRGAGDAGGGDDRVRHGARGEGAGTRRSADPPSLADRARPAGARPSAGRSRRGGR